MPRWRRKYTIVRSPIMQKELPRLHADYISDEEVLRAIASCPPHFAAMAFFWNGKPIMVDYLPTVAYNAGDVIVVGNMPMVAHDQNPPFGTAFILGSLAVRGGNYVMTADAAYPNGTVVLWNTATQKVTTTPTPGVTFPFGWIVAGQLKQAGDGGPTLANELCTGNHDPTH